MAVCLDFFAVRMGWLSVWQEAVLVTCGLAGLLAMTWLRFHRGMHPLWLFLGLLLLFQGGRLLAALMGVDGDPYLIDLQSPIPFTLPAEANLTATWLLILSAVAIYIPCRLLYKESTFEVPSGWDLTQALLILFLATFPFHIYKNVQYLLYLRAHGGYLAIYTDGGAHLEAAGSLARVLSQVCSSAFLLYFVYEKHRRRLLTVCAAYFAVTVVELLIGLRGKALLLVFTFLFLYKKKQNTHFRGVPLVLMALAFGTIAQLVAGFREMSEAPQTAAASPAAFLWAQGVSFQVTVLAVGFRHLFEPHGLQYILNQIPLAFIPQDRFGEGRLFGIDLSNFLNAEAMRLGFGTGSAYLAEAFLAGGIPGVVVASVLIGVLLSRLHLALRGLWCAFAMVAMTNLIYMPRSGLVEPFAATLKNWLALGAAWLLARAMHGAMERIRSEN
ncbi:O-antigen polysaccharide polymerase Wzy [uncultured Paludibaculum sp.]|uniref:O-antigen polysaccharide polymerase Wzy n=1 Tax=uncultured Paludibaculum sp. TaxID=1765020 RepID=UPI002AAC4970|nr:O-antigen polysaccharide polymerase Wzy [uncultured Paludibaculum sp.]